MTEDIQKEYDKELKRQLTIVYSDTVSAFLDSYMFLYPDANKHLFSSTHLFLYSYYAIRQRSIISIKKLIEPASKDRINLTSIVNLISQPDFCLFGDKESSKRYIKEISKAFKDVFDSTEASRVKDFRDGLCHNTMDKEEAMCYFKDFMFIMNEAIHILSSLYMYVFKEKVNSFLEVKQIATILAKDYWEAISNAAKTVEERPEELKRLNQLLNNTSAN